MCISPTRLCGLARGLAGIGCLCGQGSRAGVAGFAQRSGGGMRCRRNRRLSAARCAIELESLQWWRNQLAPGWYAMSGRHLLLDAGNSRLKWAVVEDGHWHATGQSDYSDWSVLKAQLKADTRCFVASVASPEHERQLAVLLEAARLTPARLRAETRFGDVKISYSIPYLLGADR